MEAIFKLALLELYKEYQRCNSNRKLNLRPCLLLIENVQSFWGQWNSDQRSITFAKKLIENHPWHDVIAVLRHEMAHQYADEILQSQSTPHGDAFQKACERVGVPDSFRRAQVHRNQLSLDWRQTSDSTPNEKLLNRVSKLLQLANSTNEHEASLAMQKVQEIYAKNNLEELQATIPTYFFHSYILTNKRRLGSLEQRVVSLLCNHFFVNVIIGFNYNVHENVQERVIELIGTRESVLMAEYVYHFLVNTCHTAASEKKFSTKKHLRSYQHGLITGLDEKLSSFVKNQESQMTHKSLMLFRSNEKIKSYISQIYPRLTSITSKARLTEKVAYEEGIAKGRQINIRKPLTENLGSLGKLLTSSQKI